MGTDGTTFAVLTLCLSIVIGLLWDYFGDTKDECHKGDRDEFWDDIDWKDDVDESKRTQSGKK